MGKRIHLDKIEKLFDKSPVVDFKSISRIIGNDNYTKLVVSNLISKNKIFRLTRGFYSKFNDVSLLVFCFKPSYLGLQSALSHHGIWDQETVPVIVTSKNVRVGIRVVSGKNILIRRVDNKFLFGFAQGNDDSFFLPYSDIEKTFIDLIFFKQGISGDILFKIKKRLNLNKLNVYLKAYSPRVKKEVLGLLD